MPQSATNLSDYDGRLVPFGLRGGVMVLAACAGAFAALLALPALIPGTVGGWTGALAFVGLQLAGLALALGPAWVVLLRRPRLRDVLVALACVPLVVAIPAVVALGVVGTSNVASNPALATLAGMRPLEVANVFATTAVQLLGEELVTILPLLVLLAALHRMGLRTWPALGISWVATSLMFGALHLPTYGWHVGQAVLVIGAARIVLTGIYLLTRNLWASTIAHIVNDWTLMALVIVAAHANAGTAA